MTMTSVTAVPIGGDTKASMRTSTTTTTTPQVDGSIIVETEEVLADGSRTVKSITYPPGSIPPERLSLPSAAASAAQAAPPTPVTPSLGRRPVNHDCQFCGHTGRTYVREKLGMCAIIGIIVLVVCFWPLFWLPLVMGSCKDKQHICTNCQREVGMDEASCDTCCNEG